MARRVLSHIVKDGVTYRAGESARRSPEDEGPGAAGSRELRSLRGPGARPLRDRRDRELLPFL